MTTGALQLVLEHFGIAVSALSGVLAARGKRVDLFGVLVLALVTAFGGGTVRDVMAGDLPVVWLRSSAYLLNAALTAVVAFFVARTRPLPATALLVADAFALAMFAILGTRKGLALDFAAPVAVLLGVVTGVAGGIIRDVLLGELPLVFRQEIHLYATAALAGAITCATLHHFDAGEVISSLTGAGVILALRLVAIRWRISLPLFEVRQS